MSDCYVCGSECEGTSGGIIDDVFQPMCHEGPDPTCYMRWSWEQGGRIDQMIADPDRYFTEAMERRRAEIRTRRESKRRTHPLRRKWF